MSKPARNYFAAAAHEDIGKKLVARLERLLRVADNEAPHDGRDRWATAYHQYYGEELEWGVTWAMSRRGEQGELAAIRINRARAYAKAFVALVTAAKPAWRPRAKTGDAGAAAATSIARALLEDFWTRRGMDRLHLKAVEMATVLARCAYFVEWDVALGEPLAPTEGGGMEMTGDVAVHVLPPWDFWTDPSLKDVRQANWWFAVVYKNRFDLAKMHPRLVDKREGDAARDAILGARGSDELDASKRCRDDESELVPVWHFFHKPTPALPKGRQVIFLAADVVLKDADLTDTYAELPVYPLLADSKIDTPEGWTSFFDTLAAQELQDATETTLATILTTYGNPSIAAPKGSGFKGDELAKGFRLLEYPVGSEPPSVIQLAQFPKDALEYKAQLAEDQRQLMGLNDVALGQPQSAQMNAQAFAVLAAMAVQQATPFQTAAYGVLEDVGLGILKTLERNVTEERELKMTGVSSEALYTVQKYSGSTLEPVDGVEVKIGNPLEQTPAGRMSILETLRNIPGLVQTAEQVYQVMETGRLDAQLRGVRDEQNLIQAEYEMLQRGERPTVIVTQNHLLHFRENAAVGHNPEVLNNPQLVAVLTEHLDEHYLNHWGVPREGDPLALPRMRFMLGTGPEPMPAAPPMPGAPGEAPMGAEGMPPPGPEGEAPSAPEALGGPTQPPLPVPMPEMPPNPLTGAPFDAATGGLQ